MKHRQPRKYRHRLFCSTRLSNGNLHSGVISLSENINTAGEELAFHIIGIAQFECGLISERAEVALDVTLKGWRERKNE